jgi:hypothetical protein
VSDNKVSGWCSAEDGITWRPLSSERENGRAEAKGGGGGAEPSRADVTILPTRSFHILGD